MIDGGIAMSRKRENVRIRQFMVTWVGAHRPVESEVLVKRTKQAFPEASPEQVAGNLSALCCYFGTLHYNSGIVS